MGINECFLYKPAKKDLVSLKGEKRDFKMKRGKLIIAGNNIKSPSAISLLSIIKKLNIDGSRWELIINPTIAAIARIRNNDAIIMACDYNCSADYCGRWFFCLGNKPIVRFAIFRRLPPNLEKESIFYSFRVLRGFDSTNPDEYFSLIKNYPGCVGLEDGKYSSHVPLNKIAKIEQIINKYEGADFDREYLSLKIKLSSSYISFLFKERMGITLRTYTQKMRFCAALRKVLSTDKQVKQIAYEAGYADPLYFGKAFKQWIGMSPKNVRRRYSSNII